MLESSFNKLSNPSIRNFDKNKESEKNLKVPTKKLITLLTSEMSNLYIQMEDNSKSSEFNSDKQTIENEDIEHRLNVMGDEKKIRDTVNRRRELEDISLEDLEPNLEVFTLGRKDMERESGDLIERRLSEITDLERSRKVSKKAMFRKNVGDIIKDKKYQNSRKEISVDTQNSKNDSWSSQSESSRSQSSSPKKRGKKTRTSKNKKKMKKEKEWKEPDSFSADSEEGT